MRLANYVDDQGLKLAVIDDEENILLEIAGINLSGEKLIRTPRSPRLI